MLINGNRLAMNTQPNEYTPLPSLFSAALSRQLRSRQQTEAQARRTFQLIPRDVVEQVLDTAQIFFQTPMAFINFVGDHKAITMFARGMQCGSVAKELSICHSTVQEREGVLVVEDTEKDTRFLEVSKAYGIRFYAGAVIYSPEGLPFATLCTADTSARPNTPTQFATGLKAFSALLTNQLKMAREAEEREEDRSKFKAFMDCGPAVAFMKDSDGKYVYVNKRFLESFQMDEVDILGKRDTDLWPPTIADNLIAHDRWVMSQLNPVQVTEAGPADASGNLTWWQSYKFVIQGTQPLLGGVALNISELHKIQEDFRKLAATDSLTGLPNRMSLNQILPLAIARARQMRKQLALLFLDVDHFKHINDNFGHKIGDSLLIAFGDQLRQCVRTSDTVFRLAGDEFVIILESIQGKIEATKVAQKIVDALKNPLNIPGHALTVSTSIGIALLPDADADPTGLLAIADHALYTSKRAGRGVFTIA